MKKGSFLRDIPHKVHQTWHTLQGKFDEKRKRRERENRGALQDEQASMDQLAPAAIEEKVPVKRQLEDIQSLRERYIVGMVAGANVYGINDELIIEKDAVITHEIVTRAEDAGKLSDLIMTMLIPGFEE